MDVDLIKELEECKTQSVDGVGTPTCEIKEELLERAVAEIERLRTIAGAVSAGPSAAEALAPLRHKAPAGEAT